MKKQLPALVVKFSADGKTIRTTWHAGREMWLMEVETTDGGAASWWATPQEMTQWVIGRRYMRVWADAHYAASVARAKALGEAA